MADPDELPTAAQSGWGAQSKASEELEFFTELALQETRRWIEVVTGRVFKYESDFRGSLEDGVLLCELFNGLRPGTIRKINKLPTPIAGLDNITVFLEACQVHFGLKDSQLFHTCDLEDLSTRAVSDCEDQLKLETERRLRNVAITIFWLGKVSRKYSYHGPLLNLSVFADLIHRGHLTGRQRAPSATSSVPSASPSVENISHRWPLPGSVPTTPSLPSATPSVENVSLSPGGFEFTPNESSDSIDRSSAYGSFRSEAKNSQSSDIFDDVGQGHTSHRKQDSYESFASDRSVTSDYHEDACIAPDYVNMPVRHGEGGSGGSGGRPGSGRYNIDSVYKANQPQASNNNNSKTDSEEDFRLSQRTPSQNSLDRLVKENDMLHSRLGTRKSVGGQSDAMRFVKTGSVTTMAEKAKEMVSVMQQQKEKKKSVELMEEDWQSNLSSWKSKMQQKFSSTLQCDEDSSETNSAVVLRGNDQTDNGENKRKSKTFKEMMEAKEQRKSATYNSIYPMDDSDDSALSSLGSKTRPSDNDDKLSMFGFHKVDDPVHTTHTVSSVTHGRTVFDSRTHDGGHTGYGGRDDLSRFTADNSSVSKKSDSSTKEAVSHPVVNVLGDQWKRPSREDPTGSSLGQSGTGSVDKLERLTSIKAWSWERKKSISDDDQAREVIAPWALEYNKTPPKSTNEHTSKPDWHPPDRRLPQTMNTNSESRPRELPIEVLKSDSPPKEVGKGFKSARDMFERTSEPEVRNIPVKVASLPRKIEVVHEPSQYSVSPRKEEVVVQKVVTKSFSKQETSRTPSGEWSMKQRTEKTEEFHRAPSTASTPEKKNHVEKVIKISQKPDHDKGFGFTIRGGKEHKSPIIVEKVILGGAADVCELMPGDEIIAINGAMVANHYQQSVQLVINQAVKAGQIELRLKRSLDKAKLGLFDEEELQMEQEQHMLQSDHSRSKTRLESPGEQTQQPVLPPWEVERKQREESERHNSPSMGEQETVRPWEQRNRWEPKPHEPSPSRNEFDWHVEKDPALSGGESVRSAKNEPMRHEVEVTHMRSHFSDHNQATHDTSRTEPTPQITAPLALGDEVTSLDAWIDEAGLAQELVKRLDEVKLQEQPPYQVAPPPGDPDRSDSQAPDEPPPLPAAPPPVPNWNTFPGQVTSRPTDLSFLDPSDLVPETTQPTEQVDSINAQLEKLRRKSEFLGQNYEDTEEYRKLKEEMEMELETNSEDNEWEKIEKNDHLSTSNLMSRFDQIPVATNTKHVTKDASQVSKDTSQVVKDTSQFIREVKHESNMDTISYQGYQSQPENNNKPQYHHGNELEMIARLEDEERRRQSRVSELDERRRREMDESAWSQDEMRGWKSMEKLRAGGPHKVVDTDDIQARTSRDIEALLQSQPKLDIRSSHRFFDLDAEQERMHTWMQGQEKKLKDTNTYSGQNTFYQEKFDRDQEQLQREQEEDLKRAGEIENEKKKQEEKLLEKELAHQRELEEIKKKRDEERLRHKQEEEAADREQQRREEIAFRKRLHKEEAEQRERQQREELEKRQQQQKEEAGRRAKKESERRQEKEDAKHHHQEELMLEEREKERLRLDKERLQQQELELRAKERELRKLEAEKMKMIEQDQMRRLEELKRYEEEQKRKEEEDRRDEDAIRQKERELRELEERLKREEAKLCLQREQLLREKEKGSYKSDKVSVSYNPPGSLQKGSFEYVYQPETAPPQLINTEHPETRQTVITERSEQYEMRSSPQVTPRVTESGSPGTKRIIKREPLIPPKQSIKAELSSLSRKDIMDMNKKPAGQQRGYDDSYQVSPSQARHRMELQAHRKSWSPEVANHELSAATESRPANGDYSQARASGMSRQEVMAMNRKVFGRREFSTPERETTREDKSPPPTSQSMTKRKLHNLGAAPKPRLIGSQTWIREEPKRGARRSEVVRSSLGTLSEHWLVEEAERQRIAELNGQEREAYSNRQDLLPHESQGDILAPPQGYQISRLSRSWQGSREPTPSRISPSRSVGGWEGERESPQRESPQRSQFSYSQKPAPMSTFRSPTRVTETERPEEYNVPQRPIPDDIKQSLIDRVSFPRDMYPSTQSQPSPTYAYPHQSSSVANIHPVHPPLLPPYAPPSPPYAPPSPPYAPPSPPYSQMRHSSQYASPPQHTHTHNTQYSTSGQSPDTYIQYTGNYPNQNQVYPQNSQAYPQNSQMYPQNSPAYPQNSRAYPPSYSQSESRPSLPQYSTDESHPRLPPSNVPQSPPQFSSQQSPRNKPRPHLGQSARSLQRPKESPPKPPYSVGQPRHSTLPNMQGTSGYPGYHNRQTGYPDRQTGHLDRPPSSSGSVQSMERAPPVPPKPPRLLSTSSSEDSAEPVVSVSASQRCSHCERSLGQGAAMVIESLNLAYHVLCFRCCVCQLPLGSGHMGADVRVRISKLHCANCYSNDEVGLKFSRV